MNRSVEEIETSIAPERRRGRSKSLWAMIFDAMFQQEEDLEKTKWKKFVTKTNELSEVKYTARLKKINKHI